MKADTVVGWLVPFRMSLSRFVGGLFRFINNEEITERPRVPDANIALMKFELYSSSQ
jgi:hypothetical protein